MTVTIEQSADVDPTAELGDGTRVWQLAQIGKYVVVGSDCVLGRGAYVGPNVRIGDRVKIQNLAQVYEPAILGDGVFIGPGAILTNDTFPRAVNETGRSMRAGDWTPVAVVVREGASIGASAVCVAPVTIGRWALVGAGAVVTEDVPAFGLVVGSPARRIGWVGRSGRPLVRTGESDYSCGESGQTYSLGPDGVMRERR